MSSELGDLQWIPLTWRWKGGVGSRLLKLPCGEIPRQINLLFKTQRLGGNKPSKLIGQLKFFSLEGRVEVGEGQGGLGVGICSQYILHMFAQNVKNLTLDLPRDFQWCICQMFKDEIIGQKKKKNLPKCKIQDVVPKSLCKTRKTWSQTLTSAKGEGEVASHSRSWTQMPVLNKI